MKLHSILLTGDERSESNPLPEKVQANIASLTSAHPNGEHTLYTDRTLRRFVADHFPPAVVDAYDELVPLAYKADLGRYCLLFVHGGLYSDIANYFFGGVCADPQNAIWVFRDCHSRAPWIVSTGLIAAPPRQPVFKRCIDQICRHTDQRYYGLTALCPTGPNLFGTELAASAPLRQMRNGVVAHVNAGFNTYPAYAYLSPKGDLVAVRNKTSAGIATLGVTAPPPYDLLYEAREIYRSDRRHPTLYSADEYAAKGMIFNGFPEPDGHRLLFTDILGTAIYGPYCTLRAGAYLIEFSFSGGPGCHDQLAGAYDIVTDYGHTTLRPPTDFRLALTSAATSLRFEVELAQDVRHVEFRIHTHTPSRFRFHGLKVSRRT